MDDAILHKAMSSEDIRRYLPGAPIWLYSDLHRLKHIDELFGSSNFCFLLFLTSESYGHWTCLYRHDDGDVSFFDSYGFRRIDDELKFVPRHMRDVLNERKPFLSMLLERYPHTVRYNTTRLQGSDTSTCGRHCIAYVNVADRFRDPDEYSRRMLQLPLSPDDFVSRIVCPV